MYRQHLHRQAITNSYCCKRLKELQKEFMTLQKEYTSIHKELEDLEKDKEQLVHEVTSAYRTIDTIELLGKNESALKHDIRSLIGKKERIEHDIYKLTEERRRLKLQREYYKQNQPLLLTD